MSWNFSEFLEEDLIELIHKGILNEDMHELFAQWQELPRAVQYELIRWITEKSVDVDPKYVSSALGLSLNAAREILRGEKVYFEFPAVGREGSRMVRGIALLDLSQGYCNVEGVKKHVKTVEEFLKGKEPLKGRLGVFFDSPIEGNSFQLSLALSILLRKPTENLCWSGGVDRKGNILGVDGLEEKRKICNQKGKRLVSPTHLHKVSDLVDWFQRPFIDVPVLVSKESQSFGEFFKDKLTLDNLKHIHGINEEFLNLYIGQLEGEGWKKVCEEFIGRIRHLDGELHGRLRLNVGINGPASLSMALGILYTHTRPFVFLHYNQSERNYYPIKVNDTRKIKELVREREFITENFEDSDGRDLGVVLFFGHHNPVGAVKEYLQKENIPTDLLVLSPASAGGNVSADKFLRIAQECASSIQDRKGVKSYERVHFFFSCPVAIAFLLGVAYGHYDRGYIYNYNKTGYERVLSIEFLRDLVELNRGG